MICKGYGDCVLRLRRSLYCSIFGFALLAGALSMRAAAEQTGDLAAGPGFATIVMYHRFGDERLKETNIRLDQLEAHLSLIEERGFTVLPVIEIVTAIREGTALPQNALGITVDDAYLSFFENGWPLFRERGLPVTLFVATDPLDYGLPDYMSWTQLRTVMAEGVDVGGHTGSHPHMTDSRTDTITDELARSMQRFREELGTVPVLFAYPYGEYSLDVIDAVRSEGFVAAFGQHSGAVHSGLPEFELPRFSLNERFGSEARFSDTVLTTIPLVVSDVIPQDPVITTNPPAYSMVIDAEMGDLGSLACYVSGQGKAELKLLADRRIEVIFREPLGLGRSRVNCTMPGPEGTWRWFSRQFYNP